MAKPVTPATARGEQTRQRLLDAAEKEFGEKGFHTASITSITQRAGVAQGTFYIYFRSKEDILRALVRHMGSTMRRSLTAATHGLPDRVAVEKAAFRHFLRIAVDHSNLYRILLECQFIDPALYQEHYQRLLAGYVPRLVKAQEAGEIRSGDPEALAWLLMGINYFFGQRYAAWEHRMPPDEVVDTVVAFIEQGMRLEETAASTVD